VLAALRSAVRTPFRNRGFLVVTAIAADVPARRAARVDPLRALRME
jgi:ABC-type lipoprotein release transport system permease subunit